VSTHIQDPNRPNRTRCGRRINGLVVFCFGPFGTCLSCQALYAKDIAKGGDAQ
jgi:hypothetical protein